MGLMAMFTKGNDRTAAAVRSALETVEGGRIELEAATAKLTEVVRASLETTVNRTLAENARVTGRRSPTHE